MSTTTLTDPHVIRVQRALVIGLIAILIITSFALIAAAIWGNLTSSTLGAYQADRIPVVKNSISTISIPIPPASHTRLVLSETSVLAWVAASEPTVLSIPVATPPF